MDYHPLAADHYALHLGEVNSTRSVLANEDIYNADGMLLVKKGAAISPEVARRMANFKLLRPLESGVSIAHEIDGPQLHKELTQLLRSDTTLHSLCHGQGLLLLLQNQCNHYQQYAPLHQKITVLAERMPQIYRRSLQGAVFCLLMGKQMRLTASEIDAVFLAALGQDIGMLHINPALPLCDRRDLTDEQWRQLQAHPVISQKILRTMPGMPPQVCRAVLEHHESCDGTGYPFRKSGAELCQLGQLVALADRVVLTYQARLRPRGDSWRQLIPMLQMNSQAHYYQNYAALINLLRTSETTAEQPRAEGDLVALVDSLLDRIALLQYGFQLLIKPMSTLDRSEASAYSRSLVLAYTRITLVVRGSGLLEESYCRWLRFVRAEQDMNTLGELREASLMLEELANHLHRLCQLIDVYPAGGATPMAKLQGQIAPWRDKLAEHLDAEPDVSAGQLCD
ncbi:HD-GYP domain-containing protein [Marinimicrobium sp. ABcell2]|uniref:HD-GYP domain-containing protein n=1 Tax=Marinimicrobium sp. ABcell2 TaxID=3069751 RepID=UPI0027B728D9|nr:HD domain-containing phosphohydrolase [Marinimicrobium sp. ABcell2]MDQ2075397.1 HD domain-containing phosphohydrolase [Marinimicrobium sp. ABcell2]